MYVLGLSCYYHDAAACLVKDGEILAAAHEERFNRQKCSPDFPEQAINYCLQEAGITIDGVDRIVFYEKPFLKFERVLISHIRSYPRSRRTFLLTLPPWLQDRFVLPLTLRSQLGYEGKVHFLSHHLSHAASAFFASPFKEAAILTADGVGEWATTTLGRGKGTEIDFLHELRYPDSLGLLYTAVTTYLGFEALQGEGKVMALADFGEPRFLDPFRQMVTVRDDGSFRIDPRYFPFHEGARMYSLELATRLDGPPREAGSELTQRHKDIAASLQRFLEDVLIKMARNLQNLTGLDTLCLAGGVSLNISATSRILEETPFTDLYIQPAAGDAGGALGAALFLYHALSGKPRGTPMTHAYLGPAFPSSQVERLLHSRQVPFKSYGPEELIGVIARRIAEGEIVGWFQGRMEYGPRALGHRSILADPRLPDMKDRLNARVKHRESFRPYGVSILLEDVGEYFAIDRSSPFMLQVAKIKPGQQERIPAVMHVNGTSRLQTLTREDNGLYYDLVKAFKELTGIPMILNTSFNDRGEPIVCTPEDALDCFGRTRMDCLVLNEYVIDALPSLPRQG